MTPHEHTDTCPIARVFRCDECGFLFEEGIADRAEGVERCPQCGLANAREVDALQIEDFVLRHGMKFR